MLVIRKNRYKFSAKELDNETNYSYFGARYYDSDLSQWLSVDAMSDKYPDLSPYNYCAWNPVVLVDPDGNDWYQDEETGNKTWREGNKDQIVINGKTYNNIGTSTSFQYEKDNCVNYYQDVPVTLTKTPEDAEKLVLNNPKLLGQFLGKDSPLSNISKSELMTSVIHNGQANFLKGGADFTAAAFNNFGNGATYVGTGLMLVPGAQPLGGALIGIGNTSSAIGTTIDISLNAIDGEWGKLINNSVSLILSNKLSRGLKNANLTKSQSDFLNGFSSSQFSIFNTIINNGLNKRKEHK